ncbi:hypothetical protein [Providencia rettgeri]|uniref:hypothetical protein n=1 Tax=Providencia rettgeri TaxID=587 RepID=UPI001C3F06E6|nr:hypothetical protein [Providencia rettgeri]
MDKNIDLRKLPLSHLVYLNSEVDADKANKFVVYHYPLLNNNYQWKEKKAWEERIDAELDSRQFAYLMKKMVISLVSMWLYKAQVIFLRLL